MNFFNRCRHRWVEVGRDVRKRPGSLKFGGGFMSEEMQDVISGATYVELALLVVRGPTDPQVGWGAPCTRGGVAAAKAAIKGAGHRKGRDAHVRLLVAPWSSRRASGTRRRVRGIVDGKRRA